MDAEEILYTWKLQLLSLAAKEKPYMSNWKYEVDQYRRALATIQGYSEKEIAAAEARLDLHFPTVYRTFLQEMGRKPSLLFWRCALPRMNDFEEYRARMSKFMRYTNPDLSLPKEAVVFLVEHDYHFLYILGTGGFDGPVFRYTDDGEQDHMLMISLTFAELIEEEVRVIELLDRENRLNGNYGSADYLFDEDTVDPEGRPLPKPWWLREGINPILPK